MRRHIRLIFVFFVFVCLLILGAAGHEFRLFERGWFNLKTWWQPAEQSIGLDRYQVVLEARPIEGWTTTSRR